MNTCTKQWQFGSNNIEFINAGLIFNWLIENICNSIH